MILKDKKILVGITGSIASYKACDLIRHLQKKGAEVKAIMTPSAKQFVGELTIKALTGYEVLSDWKDGETGLEHIYMARWPDSFVIAPASANTLAKLRIGLTDNFLTSVALAYDKPIVIAPAMNTKMLQNPATQENIKILKERGYIFVETKEGILACGEEGVGKLADIEDIETVILYSIEDKPLKDKTVLISAGGTREYFDPIRYISNNSSGQMGYALAKMAYVLGAKKVILISAPTCLRKPYGVEKIDVVSAEDMYKEVMKYLPEVDIIIMNSAVADFKPKTYSKQKLKKAKEKPIVELESNPDILKTIGEKKSKNQVLIGFAAESENILENAIDKLQRKNLDVIVANKLNVFSSREHTGIIIFKNREKIEIPPMDKESSALFILKNVFK
ncbi:bifunctional phosphopantothenoylcysteine decarboxylase/phosphopantothenate--cysteine ligase CoaBC [Hydrogenothermus marinus]|uniref:Coenzyme A biosynthesis bifunctional protein CoaBC n=1 Tax=Hydrogenothermus marinus TaxID=133270 RepID=A0A3M0BSS5_9AQUI|nr:bifunctional phosphopantothenoylcysteine decarboxylase/phosphopantothenate--cysteine ligase CoaBC [Hydrogenothermus marinus]RMA97565.1 phosphopantothenate-cysteine ligase /phosphopantothenoylcysteine decarboxylase [Hydrogenothermus marinus]